MYSSEIEVSYFAAGIVAHILSDDTLEWSKANLDKSKFVTELVSLLCTLVTRPKTLFVPVFSTEFCYVTAKEFLLCYQRVKLCPDGQLMSMKWSPIAPSDHSILSWRKINLFQSSSGPFGPCITFVAIGARDIAPCLNLRGETRFWSSLCRLAQSKFRL